MLRMRRQAGVEDARHLRVRLEAPGDLQAVRGFQVERNAPLVPVDTEVVRGLIAEERRPPGPGVVALVVRTRAEIDNAHHG